MFPEDSDDFMDDTEGVFQLDVLNVSLQGQLTDEGVTDVLVLTCSSGEEEGLQTVITLTHEGVTALFPIVVGFLLREHDPDVIRGIMEEAIRIEELFEEPE